MAALAEAGPAAPGSSAVVNAVSSALSKGGPANKSTKHPVVVRRTSFVYEARRALYEELATFYDFRVGRTTFCVAPASLRPSPEHAELRPKYDGYALKTGTKSNSLCAALRMTCFENRFLVSALGTAYPVLSLLGQEMVGC